MLKRLRRIDVAGRETVSQRVIVEWYPGGVASAFTIEEPRQVRVLLPLGDGKGPTAGSVYRVRASDTR
jgi:hypothetical protein